MLLLFTVQKNGGIYEGGFPAHWVLSMVRRLEKDEYSRALLAHHFLLRSIRLSFSHKELNWLFLFVTLREVITILLIHYFFAGYVLPKVLLRAQWALFCAYLLLTYVFMVSSQYYSFYFQNKFGLVPSYSAAMVKFYLQYDFLHTLVEPVRMLNTILFYSTLFFTLLIKITKSFFIASMDRLSLERRSWTGTLLSQSPDQSPFFVQHVK
jgi:hypothetical protein